MSAGLFERAAAFRRHIADLIAAAGIKRVLTVCPGCADELRADMPQGVELVPMPELMLEVAQTRIAAAKNGEGAEGLQDAPSASCAAKCAEIAGFSPLSDVASVTFFDSCHDRADNRNARAIRELVMRFMPQVAQIEIAHTGKDNLCCGAGGAVSSYDPDITSRRIARVVAETSSTGAAAAITACPTCSYTFAQELLRDPHPGFEALHYLELMFGVRIDWARVFDELGSMWSGEYAAWLMQTFYS
jgi:Fe-S oxidoreductase